MKIACIGNMNNTMFSLFRHLVSHNFNAHLILVGDENHFQPDSDTYEIEKYAHNIKEVTLFKNDILSFDRKLTRQYFKNYNFIICSGVVLSYLNYAGIIIDLYIPYGSDFYSTPFELNLNDKSEYNRKASKVLAINQKNGIRKSRKILWDISNSEFDRIIKRLNIESKIIYNSSPFIYTNEFNPKDIVSFYEKSVTIESIKHLKEEYDTLIFSHIRQCWLNPPDEFSYKGNERIFRAFAKLLSKYPSYNPVLIVFEYGPDVDHSKKLVKDLNIERNVFWQKKTSRKEILTMISMIDIGIGEVGDLSWFSYGAIFEFLAFAKPVIHNRKDELYFGKVKSFYPMYSASNEEEIFKHLENYYINSQSFVNTGKEAYNWYMTNSINKSLKIIESLIKESNSFVYKITKKTDEFILLIRPIRFTQRILLFIELKAKYLFKNKQIVN